MAQPLLENRASSGVQANQASVAVEPRWILRGTVPALHGLRAISIAFVLVEHICEQQGLSKQWRLGSLGVEVFFVISGFLITLLLERERRRTQTISLKQFYIRRCLRIVPAYAFFLSVMFGLQCLGYLSIHLRSWLVAGTYTTSIIPGLDRDLGHTWSLSIEEIFYLFWPLLFMTVGRRRAAIVCIAYIGSCTLIRAILWTTYFKDSPGPFSFRHFPIGHMDSIAAGCFLAIMATSARYRSYIWAPVPHCVAALVIATCLLCITKSVTVTLADNRFITYYDTFASDSVHAVLLTIMIWSCIRSADLPLIKVLSWRPVCVVGMLSYSIYLWQQPFTSPDRMEGIFAFPTNLIAIFVVAGISYVCIESPFLRLKSRFSKAA